MVSHQRRGIDVDTAAVPLTYGRIENGVSGGRESPPGGCFCPTLTTEQPKAKLIELALCHYSQNIGSYIEFLVASAIIRKGDMVS